MATNVIQNIGTMQGTLGDEQIDFLTTIAEVNVVTGLVATKTANRTTWVNGELIYTVTVTNDASNPPFTGGYFIDVLDDAMTLAPGNSILVNDSPVPFTFLSQVLTVPNLPTIDAGGAVTIEIHVLPA